jgi:hypothetical protein
MVGAGKRDTVSAKQEFTKCVVVSESVLRTFGTEHAYMMVEYFPGIKTEELHRVIEKSDLDSPANIIIHVCTNDMRTMRNLNLKWEKYMCWWLRQRGNPRNADFS